MSDSLLTAVHHGYNDNFNKSEQPASPDSLVYEERSYVDEDSGVEVVEVHTAEGSVGFIAIKIPRNPEDDPERVVAAFEHLHEKIQPGGKGR